MSATIAPATAATAQPVPRLLTVADLAALPGELPTGPVKYELEDGRLVVMAPPGDIHGSVGGNMIFHLKLAEQAGHGKAWSEVGVILRRNPDRVVAPDACFVANASLPLRTSSEGYLETIPDLVVEVRSKNDTMAELERKAGEYLAAGAKLVWVIDPLRSAAVVYQAGHPPRTLGPSDELTADGVIHGFVLSVAGILRV
ncbi:MAG TPA: Uma2 family endonuclease [Gemmataceae bacterium]|jgi:Uma2 family endonuclease